MKIVVLEPGAWGTTLGILLSRAGDEVSFWYENSKLASSLSKQRENERLAGIKIPKKIFISSVLSRVLENADLIIIASPSFNFRRTLLKLKKKDGFKSLPPLLGIAKGIEKETLKLPSQIVEELLGNFPYAHLSGPGFAREIARGKKAKEVIASKDRSLLKKLKELFRVESLKVSFTHDLIGVELAGALKNALAIGISLVEADIQNPGNKQVGDETKVSSSPFANARVTEDLISLALKEMVKIGKAMGAKKETFFGPAGLEDLILTSTNPLSRNFQFGKAILLDAEKMRRDIRERKVTVEGFDNVFALHKLGEIYKLDLPMVNEIYKVIYKRISPQKTVKNLISLAKEI